MQQRDHEDEDALLGGVQISDEEKYKDCERLEIICPSPTCGRKLVLDAPFINAVSEFESELFFSRDKQYLSQDVAYDPINLHFGFYYAPNFEKVEGAYCFGLVRPSIRLCVCYKN